MSATTRKVAQAFDKLALKHLLAGIFWHLIAATFILIGLTLHNNKLSNKGLTIFRKKAQPRYRIAVGHARMSDACDPSNATDPSFYDKLALLIKL